MTTPGNRPPARLAVRPARALAVKGTKNMDDHAKGTCPRCKGPKGMLDDANAPNEGATVGCLRRCRKVEHGVEYDVDLTIKATVHVSDDGHGHINMVAAGGDWSDKALGLRGRVEMAGMDTICSVREAKGAKPRALEFKIKAERLVTACLAVFRSGS